MRKAATALCIVAVAGMVAGWVFRESGLLRQLIGAASTAYLGVAVAAPAGRDRYGRWVLVGLIFCWLGDMLGPKSFLTGVVMFLLAHFALIGAFIGTGLKRRRLLLSSIGAAALGGAVALWVMPRVPEAQRPLIAAYTVLVSSMLAAGGATSPVGARRLVPLAAFLFFVSDFCLAQTAFMGGGVIWTIAGYPLYYTACLLFAWSVGPGDASGPRGQAIPDKS